MLALAKQGILLIPLVLMLPLVFGINGIWYAFPLADLGAALITLVFFRYMGKKQEYPVEAKN